MHAIRDRRQRDPHGVVARHPLAQEDRRQDDGRHRVERRQDGGDGQGAGLDGQDEDAVAGHVEHADDGDGRAAAAAAAATPSGSRSDDADQQHRLGARMTVSGPNTWPSLSCPRQTPNEPERRSRR